MFTTTERKPVTDTATSTRDPVRTRRNILDAGCAAILADGSAVSLDTIAKSAGVSKGGLLHHFPSKEQLFTALADDLLERFAQSVSSHLEESDTAPGRLVRAYVRATFAELGSGDAARKDATLMAAIGVIPEVVSRAQEDGRRWREAIAADGLDPGRAAVIVRAADGTSAATLFEGHLDPDELVVMERLLIELSRDPRPFTSGS